MALGTIAAAIAGGAASAGASALVGKAFGSKSKAPKNGGITNFSAGGLTGRFDRKTQSYNVTSGAARDELVGTVSRTFGQQAEAIRGLRERVAPGFSDLRRVRLAESDNAKSAAIGNLRENLARRRILGSSFAADALSRAEREFAQERDRITAETTLQEIAATEALLKQEFETGRQEFSTKLNELNLQAELAATLTSKATANLGRMAELETRLAAESAAGAGKFFGDALQPAMKSLGGRIDTWLTS